MKPKFSLPFFFFLLSSPLFSQTGVYESEHKTKEEKIELNLRRDGVFLYTYNKEWTNCVTEGKWKPLGNGRVLLNSDYQLTNYTIEEIEEPNATALRLIIQSKNKGESPATISKLYLNGNESNEFSLDGEAGLAMLEQRQRTMMVASEELRDSLAKSDTPRFYALKGLKEVKTITLVFDLKEVVFNIKNPKANKIIITTAFAPNSAYHYLKDTEFIYDDKYIHQEATNIKLRKQKNR